eukprot:13285421-Ditylum_brightwellii.AAC.1
MLTEMVGKDNGKQTLWDNKSNDSDTKGVSIKLIAEYYAAKKITKGEKTLIETNTGKGKEMAKSMESGGNKRTNTTMLEAGRQKENNVASQLGTVQVQMDTDIDKTNKYNQGSNTDRIKEQGAKAIDTAKQVIAATAINFVVPQNSTM